VGLALRAGVAPALASTRASTACRLGVYSRSEPWAFGAGLKREFAVAVAVTVAIAIAIVIAAGCDGFSRREQACRCYLLAHYRFA